jgi:hypothetical protein
MKRLYIFVIGKEPWWSDCLNGKIPGICLVFLPRPMSYMSQARKLAWTAFTRAVP